MTAGSKHAFADNRSVTVAEAIDRFAAYDGHRHPISIATGYFNAGGFTAITDALEAAPSVRILLGAEPDEIETVDRLEREHPTVARGTENLERSLEQGRDTLPFGRDTDAALQRLLRFLDRPTTQVRIYRKRFLHGKAFVFGTDGAVIAGSANFTRAGLLSNYELDLGQYDPDKVERVARWYDELWEEAESFDLSSVYQARYAEYEPYRIYLRMLYEYYGAETNADDVSASTLATLRLSEFQRLGSLRAKRILEQWGGVMVADGVGLGKTFVAGDVIAEYAKERGEHVLVICPASLRPMWRAFATKYNLPLTIASYSQLASDRQVGQGDANALADLAPRFFRLVVADEAHALRSPDTGYYKAMRTLMRKSPEARLLLLTATPVNNSLRDLYHEIMLFARSDARFANVGIPSLHELFSRAERIDPEDLEPSALFPLLDAIAVRRTRSFVKREFPGATMDGPNGPLPLVFPNPELQRIGYDLDGLQPGLFARVADAIESGLTLARYRSLAYALNPDEFSTEAVRQEILSGLLRSQMLKRFESSIEAFRRTLRRIAEATRILARIVRERHVVPIARFDPFDIDLDDLPDGWDGSGEDVVTADRIDAQRLLTDLDADAATIGDLLASIEDIESHDDPKIDALVALLEEAGEQSGDAQKTLVFTSFTDTVDYLRGHLEHAIRDNAKLAYLRGHMAFASADLSADERAALAVEFAPRSMAPDSEPPENEYNLLIATDVLSEGQNLQQCGRLVNYDLPWNPMRIAQRNGRIDRIGSPFDRIWIACFFPDAELDKLLGLEARLRKKIAFANAALGTDSVLPEMLAAERVFVDEEKTIRRMHDEDVSVLDELDKDDAYLGELFREELRRALLHEARAVYERLPWGAGSGFSGNGPLRVVYLARVGRRSELVTYIPPNIDPDRLRSLRTAKCTPDTARVFSEALRDATVTGWDTAKATLVAKYQQQRDPRGQQIPLPKPQREALALLQRAGTEETFAAAEALSIPWPIDVVRALREIVRDQGIADSAKVTAILQLVNERGLVAAPPEPLEEIIESDVRLICYQVVS